MSLQSIDSVLYDADTTPLVVDLDGTLLKTDLLYESYYSSLSLDYRHHFGLITALKQGKAQLKQFLASAGDLDYSRLPYDEVVLDLIGSARDAGRPVYLATACDQRHADTIAAHLGVFDGVFASKGTVNLSSAAKAQTLVENFGRRGFDYVGNDAADLAVWAEARKAYAIRTSTRVGRALDGIGVPVERLRHSPVSLRSWAKAVRVHQYAKNLLVFVPLLTAHAFSMASLLTALLAFAAFSACASAVYLINDLIDLQVDREHPSKRRRALASGAIPIAQATMAIPALLALAAVCALLVSVSFAGILATYFAVTTAYSLSLKRKMLIDAVVLAALYTIRVVGGAVAIDVVVSEWLLAFSMFIFLSLALMKRYVELKVRIDSGRGDPSNRDYKLDDTVIVAALAAASGFNAVTIFSLYIASPSVQGIYRHPAMLWLICPLLAYWIARALMLAHRGVMDDDPLVFALRDRASWLTLLVMVVLVLIAI